MHPLCLPSKHIDYRVSQCQKAQHQAFVHSLTDRICDTLRHRHSLACSRGSNCSVSQWVSWRAETALSRLNQQSLERVFAVNAFGPILVSKVRCSSFLM